MADGAIEATAIMLRMTSKTVHASANTFLSMAAPVAGCMFCFDFCKCCSAVFPLHMSVDILLRSACIHAGTAEMMCLCQYSDWDQLA